jgi:aminoglycoside 2'-N-acetyltransferase I
MYISVIANHDRTDRDREQLKRLGEAVYPEDDSTENAEDRFSWANTEISIILREEADGEIAAHAGVLVRDCLHDDRPVRIGGIGGVKTHPGTRKSGLGRLVMTRAVEILRDDLSAEFGLLVCPSTALGFYKKLGWREFPGSLWIEQPDQQRVQFTMNHVMVIPLRTDAPESGSIDLCGLPW